MSNIVGMYKEMADEIGQLKADLKQSESNGIEFELQRDKALVEIEHLKARIKAIEEAATAAYRYHMLGYKDATAFNANVMLDHMNKLGEVL